MSEKVTQIIQTAEKLFHNTERSNMETLWDEIAEFVLPAQRNLFNGVQTPGDKKTRRLYDSTGLQANHDLAASIHSTLNNPATQWSKIRFKDEDLNNSDEATDWLEDVNRRIHTALNESNFDSEIGKNYRSYTSLGTMALLHDSSEDGFRFKAVHLGEYAIAENSKSEVDVFYRKFKMTVRQAVENFGDSNHSDVLRMMKDKPYEMLEFLQEIVPRDPKDIKLNEFGLAAPENRPFSSHIIDCKHQHLVEEGGYYEFPVYITRWELGPNEVYGRSPAHNALPDIRTLNILIKKSLQALAKAVHPPILVTERGVLGNLDYDLVEYL